MSVSGGSRHHGKRVNKVSVIGGGDLGMASVMSILSKVLCVLFIYENHYPTFYGLTIHSCFSTDSPPPLFVV